MILLTKIEENISEDFYYPMYKRNIVVYAFVFGNFLRGFGEVGAFFILYVTDLWFPWGPEQFCVRA